MLVTDGRSKLNPGAPELLSLEAKLGLNGAYFLNGKDRVVAALPGMPWAFAQDLAQVTESVLLVLHQTGTIAVEMGTDCLTLCQDH
ncbi:MAG: hypothetical protein FRX49_09264 [Trebouxia sp. A1-2]|nr:MAG: hypothetical protein FRX49_09264 [Trebouxia sp. A1-2]